MWRHRASIAREGSNELGVCFTDMGCPALPGKSRGAVHKRATAIRRHQPALILPAAGMTLFPTMSRFSHSAALAALIASAGLLVGCGQGQKQAAAPPAKVTVATPVKRTIVDQDEYVGRFVAVDSVEIRSRVSGYLDQVHFQDGQMVKQGDLLFTIDKRPFQNTLDQARANLELAKSNLTSARPAAVARPHDQRADFRAACPAGAQRTSRGDGERGDGAPGRARLAMERAQGACHRPHRRSARIAGQPRDRGDRRQHDTARHHRLDGPDPIRIHVRRSVAVALRAPGAGWRHRGHGPQQHAGAPKTARRAGVFPLRAHGLY